MQKSFSIYIHIPWCIQKCPYCDFNSHAQQGPLPEEDYINKLITEFDKQMIDLRDRKLISIFIGGGTPSLFQPKNIAKVITHIKHHCHFDSTLEVTMEANPGSLEHYPFADLLLAGINRLSLGAQSFSNQQLLHLGRIHKKEAIAHSVTEAKQAGFRRINLDIMYGLHQQSCDEALHDLQQAIALDVEHLSWYQLTIEPHTAFYYQKPKLPEDEQLLEIMTQGQELLAHHHYQPYEISAYTRKQACTHNLHYWRFGDYLGLGAGAHSKLSSQHGCIRFWNYKHPKQYLRSENPRQGTRTLKNHDLRIEFLMNQLRLYEPLQKNTYERMTQQSWHSFIEICQQHDHNNWLQYNDHQLTLTKKGRVMVDEILTWFC